jgi:hypothetical protein
MAISACVSPGVQTSISRTSSRLSSCFQSVSTDRQPSLPAAASRRPRVAPAQHRHVRPQRQVEEAVRCAPGL